MSAAEAARPASVDVDGLRIELTGTDIDVVDEIAPRDLPGRGARPRRRVGLGQDDRRAWRCSATSAAAAR